MDRLQRIKKTLQKNIEKKAATPERIWSKEELENFKERTGIDNLEWNDDCRCILVFCDFHKSVAQYTIIVDNIPEV